MQYSQDISTLAHVFSLSDHDMREVADRLPNYLADRIATKWFEANSSTLLKDKSFMEEVKRLTIEKSTEKATELITSKIMESFGNEKS